MVVLLRLYTPFHEKSDNAGTKAWNAFANAGILISVIVVMTFFILILYKYRCYKVGTAGRRTGDGSHVAPNLGTMEGCRNCYFWQNDDIV